MTSQQMSHKLLENVSQNTTEKDKLRTDAVIYKTPQLIGNYFISFLSCVSICVTRVLYVQTNRILQMLSVM